MKALDVGDLHSGIEEIQARIEIHIEQLSKIEESVTAIVGLSDSLKGEGGTAIRRFYQEGHVPLLTFLKLSLTQYNKVLSQMKASLHSLEPNIEAHHRQQVPVKNGGILVELEQRTHRGEGNHTRHDKPSQLTPSQRA
ncbi:T7SS effector LXG polymorphic toxin [Alkalihalophilus marmarensis]|uniref:T7SS effector LXG polymorphic toxin n=1 Tax=Alkalihalophilus marmarensis TaxID=521377 RepID=UPI002DBB6D5D|nr:T7SS effector LXG polymorphic toxin [Alkalihalophilus marmarensis]MEC2071423.1 T7SS effector LXG polymorphic toxin [Alkalihalophilus marmarensis]